MKGTTALKFAYDFEVKGVNLYMRLASKTRNILAREVFYSLAKQEVDHAKRIGEVEAMVKANRGWRVLSAVKPGSMEAELKKFFASAGRSQLKKRGADVQGYDLAMKMERKGYRAYSEFYRNAATAGEREFFRQMMAEENKHYEALANVYAYLTGNEDWLQAEESKTWNWMST
jgi:rubrerythrin